MAGADTMLLRAALIVAFTAIASAAAAEPPAFEIYGYAQLDYIQDFKRTDPEWQATLRPSKIPTLDGRFGSDGIAIVSVRPSRFGVNTHGELDGRTLESKVEYDLFSTGSNAGQTALRLRHAWGRWGMLLAGQTDSLLNNIDAFPVALNYWGPNGTAYLRTPQIRVTPLTGRFRLAFAIERPTEIIDSGNIREIDPSFEERVVENNKVPDATAQLRIAGDRGHIQIAGIARRLSYETLESPDFEPKGVLFGWGITASGVLNLRTEDKLKLSAVVGEGIASYMNDGGVDIAPTGERIEEARGTAVPLIAGFAYYELAWSHTLASTLGYAFVHQRNQSLQSDDAFKTGQYASANLRFAPGSDVIIGVAGLWGRREDKDGNSGYDLRAQFSFRVAFSSAPRP